MHTQERKGCITSFLWHYFYLCRRIHSLRIFKHSRISCKNQFSARLLLMHYRDPWRCGMAVSGMYSGSDISFASFGALWKEWGHDWNRLLEAQIAIKAGGCLLNCSALWHSYFGKLQFKSLVNIQLTFQVLDSNWIPEIWLAEGEWAWQVCSHS